MGMLALAQLSQQEVRERILHTWETAKETWVIPLHIGPIDISINKPVWYLWLGAALTFVLLFGASRFFKTRPGAYQVIVEELYGFGRKYLGGAPDHLRLPQPYLVLQPCRGVRLRARVSGVLRVRDLCRGSSSVHIRY